MIKIENLTKLYGSYKLALNNLNLEINSGEIFGLIGHNGAGKSTTIKSIVSIIEPTSGEIYIDGKNLKQNRLEIKKMIGYVSDTPDMFLSLPAINFWKFIASAFEIKPDIFSKRLKELCEIFELNEDINRPIQEFSHGMRQKVFIIAALLSEPKIWILDEPMTGLDPQSAYNLKQLMKDHVEKGNTVLFSTHVLEVAEQICDSIGILYRGKLLYCGSLKDLKNSKNNQSLEKIYLDMIHEIQEKTGEENEEDI